MAENPFTFVNAINSGKNIIRNGEAVEADYVPFLTNRSLSYHKDTVLYAKELNINSSADKIMQFEYYLNSVRPKKRFAKWTKTVNPDDLELIKSYYYVSSRKALEILSLLTEEQIETIKTRTQTGGKT